MGFAENMPYSVPEKKELPKETLEKTRLLCAEYHAKLDQTSYFDSKAISLAAGLLKSFKEIKQDLLPPTVKQVVRHRLAYLSFIASFQGSPAIGNFFDFVKNGKIVVNSPEEAYELVHNSEKYKALSSLDLRLISSSLSVGIQTLNQVNNSQANWGREADGLLRPNGLPDIDVRVDDEQAAKRLQQGFRKMLQFVDYAKMKMYQRR